MFSLFGVDVPAYVDIGRHVAFRGVCGVVVRTQDIAGTLPAKLCERTLCDAFRNMRGLCCIGMVFLPGVPRVVRSNRSEGNQQGPAPMRSGPAIFYFCAWGIGRDAL